MEDRAGWPGQLVPIPEKIMKPKFTPEAGVRRTKESSENKVASDGDGYLFIYYL